MHDSFTVVLCLTEWCVMVMLLFRLMVMSHLCKSYCIVFAGD